MKLGWGVDNNQKCFDFFEYLNLEKNRPQKYAISDINMLVDKLVMAGIIVLIHMTDNSLRDPFPHTDQHLAL